MKAKFTILGIVMAFILLMPTTGKGQYRSFILGIKAGPSISWLNPQNKNYDSEGTRIGFNWGIVSEIYFAKNYALATGLNFQYLNGSLSYSDLKSGTPVLLQRDYRFRYLEIPAVLKLKTNQMGEFRYFGQIGLGLGIRMTSKGRDEFALNNQTLLVDFDNIDSQTRLFRTSMIVGAGIEYPFDNNTAAIMSLNFNNGLNNVLKGKNSVFADTDHEAKANFIEVSIGLMF